MRKKKQKEEKSKAQTNKAMFNIPQNSPQKLSLMPFINPFETSKIPLRKSVQSTSNDYSNGILPTPPSFLREYKRCNGGTIDDFVNVNNIRQMAPESRQILNQNAFSSLSCTNTPQQPPPPEFSRIPRTPPNQQHLLRSIIYFF